MEAYQPPAAEDKFEELLMGMKEQLGPDHYLVVRLKEKYLKSCNVDCHDLSVNELEMRVALAGDILRVKGRLEPGETSWMTKIKVKKEAYLSELSCRRITL